MKNIVAYQDLQLTDSMNTVNVEKLLYFIKKEELKKKSPTNSLSFRVSGIDSELINRVKNYLNQDDLRELVRNSFGDDNKKQSLLETIKSFISRKEILDEFSVVMKDYSLEEIADYITEEIAGLSVLKNLIKPTTTDINIYNWDNIWLDDYEVGIYKADMHFDSKEDYMALLQRFVNASGKNWSKAKPMVSAEFPQMRVKIVGYDVAPKVSTSIRIISKKLRLSEEYIVSSGYATQEMINLLKAAIQAKQSVIITGETGSGKSELLRFLTGFTNTKKKEKIIMIEDQRETYLDEIYPDFPIDMWATREPNEKGENGIDYGMLIAEALRHNPDWLMIQESRSKEFFNILEATQTGHGMITTLHAKSAIHAVKRMIDLSQQYLYEPADYYGVLCAEYIKFGVHLKRIGNKRKIVQIVEYVGYENNQPIVNVLFEYNKATDSFIKKDEMSRELANQLQSEGIALNS